MRVPKVKESTAPSLAPKFPEWARNPRSNKGFLKTISKELKGEAIIVVHKDDCGDTCKSPRISFEEAIPKSFRLRCLESKKTTSNSQCEIQQHQHEIRWTGPNSLRKGWARRRLPGISKVSVRTHESNPSLPRPLCKMLRIDEEDESSGTPSNWLLWFSTNSICRHADQIDMKDSTVVANWESNTMTGMIR